MVSCVCRPACVLVALVLALMPTAHAQDASSTPATAPIANKQLTSIGDALRRPGNEPVHLLYIHGIGATEPYDSSDLRVSICKELKDCIVKGGEAKGREYADQGVFDPDVATVPNIT